MGFPGGASDKESTCQYRRYKRLGFDPWVRKIPWRSAWQPTPVFLPGDSHGQRSLAGRSPWGRRVGREVTEHAPRKKTFESSVKETGGRNTCGFLQESNPGESKGKPTGHTCHLELSDTTWSSGWLAGNEVEGICQRPQRKCHIAPSF